METKRQIRSNGRVVGWVLDSGASRRVEPTHRTVMTADEFKPLLTRQEFKAFRNSTVPIIADTFYLLANRNGVVDTESQIFSDVMEAAVESGDLTRSRADELTLGFPL